jgi:hypothetical protein
LWIVGATDTDLNRASLTGFQHLLALEGYRQTDLKQAPNTQLAHYVHGSTP